MYKILLFMLLFLPLSIRAQERSSILQSEVENFAYRIDRMISRKQIVVGYVNALQVSTLRLKDVETMEQKSGLILKTNNFEAFVDSSEVRHLIRRLAYLNTTIQNTTNPQEEHIWFVTNGGIRIDVSCAKYIRTHFDTQEQYTVYEWTIYIDKYPFDSGTKYILDVKKLETFIKILTTAQNTL